MTELNRILKSVQNGERAASDELLPLVYTELRQIAARHLAKEKSGQTLQPTDLVHEAYLRLLGLADAVEWENRRHFFAAASEAMRRILVERARRRATVKHGGNFNRLDLEQSLIPSDERCQQLLELDEALTDLERHDASAAELVKLRYFGGMNHQDAAISMQISRRAADRLWALAKAWLYKKLNAD